MAVISFYRIGIIWRIFPLFFFLYIFFNYSFISAFIYVNWWMKFPCVAQPQILEAVGEWCRAHYDWPDSMNFDWVDFISSLIGSDWFMAACGEKERERKEERERDRERERREDDKDEGGEPRLLLLFETFANELSLGWDSLFDFFLLLLLLLLFSFLKQISNSHLSLHKYIFFFYTSDVWFGSEIDKFHPPKTENWNWNWTIWNKKKFLIWISGILFFFMLWSSYGRKKNIEFRSYLFIFYIFEMEFNRGKCESKHLLFRNLE